MSRYDDFIDTLREDLKELSNKVVEIDKKLDIHTSKFDSHVEHEANYYNELKVISETLVKNTQSLNEHMKRTALLEEAFSPVRTDYIARTEFKKSLVLMSKILGGIVALGTIITGFLTFIGKL